MKMEKFECSAVLSWCEIEFTNICGLDCFGCIRKDSPEYGFLSFEILQKIVSFIKKKWYSQIVLSWLGDVFLHKDFYTYIDYIFEEIPDIYIYVMTKGQSLKKDDIDTFAVYKQRGKRLDICYSLFSLEAKKYTQVTWWWDLKHLLEIIKYSHEKNINYNFEFFLDIHTLKYVTPFRKFAQVFWKEFHFTIPHNWWWKLAREKYEKIFDETILSSIIEKRSPWEICEAFCGEYLFFDYRWEVYKCGLKRFEEDLHVWNISQGSQVIDKNIDMLDYTHCANCSYYHYKTKIW